MRRKKRTVEAFKEPLPEFWEVPLYPARSFRLDDACDYSERVFGYCLVLL